MSQVIISETSKRDIFFLVLVLAFFFDNAIVFRLFTKIVVVSDTQSDSIHCLNFAKKRFIQYSIQHCLIGTR